MLDGTITLPVDVLNNGTTSNRVYTRMDEYLDRSVYKGPDHSFIEKDTLGFYRTRPKATSVDYGVAKSAIKLTQDVTVAGKQTASISKPMIADCSFNIPVGTSAADTLQFRQRLIAVLDHAIAASLVDQLEV